MSDWIFKKSLQVRNGVEQARDGVKTFVKGEEAPTAVEYGIMVALIAVAIITIVTTLGTTLSDIFTNVNTKISSGTGST